MQLGQLFGAAGSTSPLASDFLSGFAGKVMEGMTSDNNFATGAFSTSPGALGVAAQGPLKPPGSQQFPTPTGMTDEAFNSELMDLFKYRMSDEYAEKNLARKQKQNRQEMNQALQGRFMTGLAENAGKGAMLEGGAIGQGYANMANILGGTRLPSTNVGGANIAMPQRKYFGA